MVCSLLVKPRADGAVVLGIVSPAALVDVTVAAIDRGWYKVNGYHLKGCVYSIYLYQETAL